MVDAGFYWDFGAAELPERICRNTETLRAMAVMVIVSNHFVMETGDN